MLIVRCASPQRTLDDHLIGADRGPDTLRQERESTFLSPSRVIPRRLDTRAQCLQPDGEVQKDARREREREKDRASIHSHASSMLSERARLLPHTFSRSRERNSASLVQLFVKNVVRRLHVVARCCVQTCYNLFCLKPTRGSRIQSTPSRG